MKDGWDIAEKSATRSKRSSLDLRGLKELVKQGENERIEFKLKAAHPEKIIREIVAFANTDGGTLLVGVSDDGSIPGLKFADDDEYTLVRAIEKHCFPEIDFSLERITVATDREVLIFKIPKSQQRPHHVALTDRMVYVRLRDRSIQASKEIRQILKWKDRVRDVKFTYGTKEEALMQLLASQGHVTVESYAQDAKIPRWLASKTLITLTLANVVKIQPDEVADRYLPSL